MATEGDLARVMAQLGRAAAGCRATLAQSTGQQRNAALIAAAARIRASSAAILAANARDMDAARARNLSAALLDRLQLNESRVEAMARGIEDIVALADPVGTVIAEWTRPNGLVIQRVRVPLGVIGIIYESRPNVTADAGALCLKSANPVILRGGSESRLSSAAIHACLVDGLKQAGLPEAAIQLVPTADRAAVGMMLSGLDRTINVIVPRGGRSLVERVQAEARVPVIGHLEGLCHVYVDRDADLDMATRVVVNAKLRRTGVCGAAETLLVDRGCAPQVLPALLAALAAGGCELRGDAAAQKADARVRARHRAGLAHRIPGRHHVGARRGRRGRRHRAHRALRLGAHRIHRHGKRGNRRAVPARSGQRDCPAQRVDPVRRWR